MRLLLPFLLTLTACGGELCPADGPQRDGLDPTGEWLENYHCFEADTGFCEQEENVSLQVELLDGDAVRASEPGATWRIEGLLCGGTFNWIGSEDFPDGVDNYVETGAWVFNDAGDTFTKTSDYEYTGRDGGGTCVGTGALAPGTPAPIQNSPCP